jgi:diaminopimelate epimerase
VDFVFFWKAHGTGNDFILVDDRSCTFPIDDPLLIERLCDRHRGIGADGLILLQNSSLADFKYRIFNSDGYEASMCGNGLRCLVLFLEDIGCNQDSFLIETNKGIRKVGREGENISVSLGEAMFIYWQG